MSYEKLIKKDKNNIYFVLDCKKFFSRLRISNIADKESFLKYRYSEKTKDFIELVTSSEIITTVIKIPIEKTNLTEDFISFFIHPSNISKYHKQYMIFYFEPNKYTLIYEYEYNAKPINLTNNNFYSLSELNEEDLIEDIDDEFEEEIIDQNYIIENKNEDVGILKNKNELSFLQQFSHTYVFDSKEQKIYKTINDNIIKNVFCYLTIEFDNLKSIIKSLEESCIQVTIENNKLTLQSIVPKKRKTTTISLSVILSEENKSNKKISFFINSKSFVKLKPLDTSFYISGNQEKKIFRYAEIKIVYDYQNNAYGMTIFPANIHKFFDSSKIGEEQKNLNIQEIYNSFLIFIPQSS